MEVILIRHTSVDVPPGVCYGQTDVPLKPTFEQEAAITQENLKNYLEKQRAAGTEALRQLVKKRKKQ